MLYDNSGTFYIQVVGLIRMIIIINTYFVSAFCLFSPSSQVKFPSSITTAFSERIASDSMTVGDYGH